jgi:hypothetical protein
VIEWLNSKSILRYYSVCRHEFGRAGNELFDPHGAFASKVCALNAWSWTALSPRSGELKFSPAFQGQ